MQSRELGRARARVNGEGFAQQTCVTSHGGGVRRGGAELTLTLTHLIPFICDGNLLLTLKGLN